MSFLKPIVLLLAAVLTMGLTACAPEKKPVVLEPIEMSAQEQARQEAESERQRNELDEARGISRDNAAKAAASYQNKNPRLTGMMIIPRADVAISLSCLHGSGWAYVNFMRAKTPDELAEEKFAKPGKVLDPNMKVETICPTYTTSLDCMRIEDIGKLSNGANPKACGNSAEIGRRLKGL